MTKLRCVPVEPTLDQLDAARSVMQFIRVQRGATFDQLRAHCSLGSRKPSTWPSWALEAEGYVSERAATDLVQHLVNSAAPPPPADITAALELAQAYIKIVGSTSEPISAMGRDALQLSHALKKSWGRE